MPDQPCSLHCRPFGFLGASVSLWSSDSLDIAVIRFAHHPRYGLARLNADRLIDNPALVRVVTHLHIPRQREVLAERVPYEAVVGKDAAQVRMSGKHDPEQVEG